MKQWCALYVFLYSNGQYYCKALSNIDIQLKQTFDKFSSGFQVAISNT